MLCWHHVRCVEDRTLLGSHKAAAGEPSTDPVSNSWRLFPGTAERITAAWTVKGNEERARHLEKIGRGMTLWLHHHWFAHREVTHHRPETQRPAAMLILQAGGAASAGITRREGWWGGEGLQAVSVAGCSNSTFPCGAVQLLGRALVNGWCHVCEPKRCFSQKSQ